MAKKEKTPPIEMGDDPGPQFRAVVQTPDGPRERHYVDMLIHSKDLQGRVRASARMPARKETIMRKRSAAALAKTEGLRIGYAFWGFLGDYKVSEEGEPLSTPDGNAAYSWSIVWEAARRGHRVIPMMMDRDRPGCRQYGYKNFSSFARSFRTEAYTHLNKNGELFESWQGLPELDVLLLEWRFPIPGRNTREDMGKEGFQPDLLRQAELLEHYSKQNTKIIVWDLDYKLDGQDEDTYLGMVHHIVETCVTPKQGLIPRTRVEPPVLVNVLDEHPTVKATTLLSYIGSRYERDDVIDEWIRPIANLDRVRGRIHFYGNWTRDLRDVQIRWPGVSFHDRVTMIDFKRILRGSAGVPLLAKREYMQRGFVTPRVWEALMFGSIPVGLQGHTGISLYTDLVARDADDLLFISQSLVDMSVQERAELRRRAIDKVSFMDARYFVDTLERLAA